MAAFIQTLDYTLSFACFLLALHLLRERSKNGINARLLGVAFLLLALQAAIFYMITTVGRLTFLVSFLPAMPLLLAGIIYLFFQSASDPDFRLKKSALLLFVPALTVVILMITGVFYLGVDLLVIGGQLFCASVLAHKARRGRADFSAMGADAGNIYKWLCVAVFYFAFMGLADLIIFIEVKTGGLVANSLPFLATLLVKLVLVTSLLLMAMQNSPHFEWVYTLGRPQESTAPPLPDTDFTYIIAAFELEVQKPDFFQVDHTPSLKEMAFRLNVPIRNLSLAINGSYRESYSRHLNRLRVERAKAYIERHPKAPMFDVMYEAGFKTKSSFNKEFKALEGLSPSEYKQRAS